MFWAEMSNWARTLDLRDLRCQYPVTLLGTTTQDVILHDIARELQLEMSTLRDTAWHHNQDVTLRDIAREKRLEMSNRSWYYLGEMT